MKRWIRFACLFLAVLACLPVFSGCAKRYDRWILGTWSYQQTYYFAGTLDCTITFEKENNCTRVGVAQEDGKYYIKEDNKLKLIIGSGSLDIKEYTYDQQKAKQAGSGCWCMINNKRMYIDGVLYSKIKRLA